MIVEISTDDLVDWKQIGWITYKEGDALIKAKVVRAKNNEPFLTHVTGFRGEDGLVVKTVDYEDRLLWKTKSAQMLSRFRKQVGEEYWNNFLPNRPMKSRDR